MLRPLSSTNLFPLLMSAWAFSNVAATAQERIHLPPYVPGSHGPVLVLNGIESASQRQVSPVQPSAAPVLLLTESSGQPGTSSVESPSLQAPAQVAVQQFVQDSQPTVSDSKTQPPAEKPAVAEPAVVKVARQVEKKSAVVTSVSNVTQTEAIATVVQQQGDKQEKTITIRVNVEHGDEDHEDGDHEHGDHHENADHEHAHGDDEHEHHEHGHHEHGDHEHGDHEHGDHEQDHGDHDEAHSDHDEVEERAQRDRGDRGDRGDRASRGDDERRSGRVREGNESQRFSRSRNVQEGARSGGQQRSDRPSMRSNSQRMRPPQPPMLDRGKPEKSDAPRPNNRRGPGMGPGPGQGPDRSGATPPRVMQPAANWAKKREETSLDALLSSESGKKLLSLMKENFELKAAHEVLKAECEFKAKVVKLELELEKQKMQNEMAAMSQRLRQVEQIEREAHEMMEQARERTEQSEMQRHRLEEEFAHRLEAEINERTQGSAHEREELVRRAGELERELDRTVQRLMSREKQLVAATKELTSKVASRDKQIAEMNKKFKAVQSAKPNRGKSQVEGKLKQELESALKGKAEMEHRSRALENKVRELEKKLVAAQKQKKESGRAKGGKKEQSKKDKD